MFEFTNFFYNQIIFTVRESFKEVNSLHLPQERYSPVRRASEGCAPSYRCSPQHSIEREGNVKSLQQECQQLQVVIAVMYKHLLYSQIIFITVNLL